MTISFSVRAQWNHEKRAWSPIQFFSSGFTFNLTINFKENQYFFRKHALLTAEESESRRKREWSCTYISGRDMNNVIVIWILCIMLKITIERSPSELHEFESEKGEIRELSSEINCIFSGDTQFHKQWMHAKISLSSWIRERVSNCIWLLEKVKIIITICEIQGSKFISFLRLSIKKVGTKKSYRLTLHKEHGRM